MTISILHQQWGSVLSYQRRFPVVLFVLLGNAKASVGK